MRSSRISHPPGSRFVAVHVWAVQRFGLAGAAILGELDFLDRAQEEPNQPLASRARIIADLEGVVGRNAIDAALLSLEAAGAISRHVLTRPGERNIERRVSYGLNLDGLANLLGSPQTGSSRSSLNREFPEVPKSGPKPGPEPGTPTYISIKEKEAAALHANSGSAAASNSSFEEKRKHPRRTANGIECWYPAEDEQADAIESTYFDEHIAAAVKTIKSKNNKAGKPTSPIPVLVADVLEKQERERQAQERLAVAEASNRAKSETVLKDPNALAIGTQILQKIRGKRQSEHASANAHDH